ncbi:hypothetical protein OWV82_021307 [Melia azedarach]|uniref:Uncharacterized protein n=1 Tax=Melia azedarach TaxID=155640 RepID=A0ACC1WZ00_MELAZ|nr:hypothetical protein OWV82_021307 [Melia azedarach]
MGTTMKAWQSVICLSQPKILAAHIERSNGKLLHDKSMEVNEVPKPGTCTLEFFSQHGKLQTHASHLSRLGFRRPLRERACNPLQSGNNESQVEEEAYEKIEEKAPKDETEIEVDKDSSLFSENVEKAWLESHSQQV